MNNWLFLPTWFFLPVSMIIGLLVMLFVSLYRTNKRTIILFRNLNKYNNTIALLQRDLMHLNRCLQEISSNETTDPVANDKIRLATWQIKSIQETLYSLSMLEKEAYRNLQTSTGKDKNTALKTSEIDMDSEEETTLVTVVPTSNDQKFLEKVFTVIRQNFDNPDFTVDILSNKMGMSRSSFFNKFKAISGQAPADFIRQYRMERAKELLRTKQYSVAEVAFKCGFSDVKYFRDVFRKKVNQSPGQFAKNSKPTWL